MTKKFATGKWAIAICDRCGRQVPYKELFVQMINMQPSGLRVCDECVDEDHPQWQIGLLPVDDPQALEFPRPSPENDRGLYGWNPVLGMEMAGSIGQVMVTT